MNTMIIWKYYYQYLKNYYANFTDDSNQWQDIIDNILEDYNGNSGSIYRHLKSKDHDCKYIIPNDKYSQVKWANQFDQKYNNWSDDILLSQIKYYTPEVILLDIGAYNSSNINFIKYADQVAVWAGIQPDHFDYSRMNILITDQHDTLLEERKNISKTIIASPGFDKKILEKINTTKKKNKTIIFLGSLTYKHSFRINILYDLLKNKFPIKIYALAPTISKRLSQNDISYKEILYKLFKNANLKNIILYYKMRYILKVAHPPIFGLEYFNKLAESHIVLNIHIDQAANVGANMRMFEATGVKSCLVTDDKIDVNEYFIPNKEVIVFQNKTDLKNKLNYLLNNENVIKQIANSGNKKTLNSYSIEKNLLNKIDGLFDKEKNNN